MSNIWDDFEASVNETELNNQLKEAREKQSEYEELPKGEYVVQFTKIECGMSKTHKPMVTISAKVVEGKYKKRLVFMNRVIAGTKNDGAMIQGVEKWLSKLQAVDADGEVIDTTFKGYGVFSDVIEDVAADVVDGEIQYRIKYDSTAFNSITVLEMLED